MKKLFAICLILVFLVTGVFAGGKKAEGKITLVYLCPNQSEAWHVATRIAGDMFAPDLGVELIVLDPNNDPAEQIKMAHDIAPQVDGAVIIMVTPEARKVAEEFKKAKPNMPVIALDRDAPSEYIDLFIAFGNYEAGVTLGEGVVEGLTEKFGEPRGKVQIVTGDMSSPTARKRRDGCLEVLKKYPKIEVVNIVEATKWVDSVAQEKMMASLEAYGRPDAVLCNFDGAATGSVNALKSKGWLKPVGDPDHVFIGSLDASTIVLKYMRDGSVDFTIAQPNLFYVPMGMYLAKKVIEEGYEALPKVGIDVEAEDIPIGKIATEHKGINPWKDPFWSPAKVVDRPEMKHPQLLTQGSLVTMENVDKPYFWGNVMPIWGK